MAIKKLSRCKWQVDIQPGGRNGKRIRKTFTSYQEAKDFVKDATNNPKKYSSNMSLSELVEFWYDDEGIDLKDSKGRKQKLDNLVERLKNCKANELTKRKLKDYRNKRAARIANSTVNREIAYLRRCYRYAISENKYNGIDPTFGLRMLPEKNNFKNYLKQKQIYALLQECKKSKNPRLIDVVMICLATGSRWGETVHLEIVDLSKGNVIFRNTKNGNIKELPVPKQIYDCLKNITPHQNGRLFNDCRAAFKNAIERAGIQLPKNQLTHVLRHTFSTHFLKNGGTLEDLNKILDHSTYDMTLRYSHITNTQRKKASKLNPLTHGGHFKKKKKTKKNKKKK